MNAQRIKIFAPAKINLHLHVTGRRDDGYHLLDSLVVFADIGDEIEICEAPDFSFDITGPFANTLQVINDSNNLVVRAAQKLSEASGHSLKTQIKLIKNIPLGAGLGGGSSDAAATVKALMTFWQVDKRTINMTGLLTSLGADVPVCFHGNASIMQGIGEDILSAPYFPDLYVLLVYPNQVSNTGRLFQSYDKSFSEAVSFPDRLDDVNVFADFMMRETRNDLQDIACEQIPVIADTLSLLEEQTGTLLTRMTGSGSACFSLFETLDHAKKAQNIIRQENPDWWVQAACVKADSTNP